MELLSKEILLESLPRRWRQQHYQNRKLVSGRMSDDIANELESKGLTHEKAMSILGGSSYRSWMAIYCNECGFEVDVAIMVGEKPDYESSTATICLNCLKEAFELAAKEKDNNENNSI